MKEQLAVAVAACVNGELKARIAFTVNGFETLVLVFEYGASQMETPPTKVKKIEGEEVEFRRPKWLLDLDNYYRFHKRDLENVVWRTVKNGLSIDEMADALSEGIEKFIRSMVKYDERNQSQPQNPVAFLKQVIHNTSVDALNRKIRDEKVIKRQLGDFESVEKIEDYDDDQIVSIGQTVDTSGFSISEKETFNVLIEITNQGKKPSTRLLAKRIPCSRHAAVKRMKELREALTQLTKETD